ncbi:heme exporter protein CcmD [Xylella taiwanensis]|uniref:Heme exporter protein D n=1 Tax=Xylella taiwanensis TaxID=1444770 RepID=Z9JI88_9GAMM|nr:heme exporter protein CcmD [Xylella taiwanensis]EWS77904.1 hypothetical protein AF72_08215 [Xylella taiwanensis]MCD8456239.1 heme exporter protein CcmD [Xylella taiwanensis]MCD8458647.1 heme exporter protein CcmD [Xylella taiwanensis]MCD8460782.1 heme exporter protein CcmD [Xylella taiwanensis]MCD8463160.1 heme exporter protein CcmD [Xylella taiwanensis]
MTHLPYVIGAYAVFVLILLWDLLAVRRQRRTAQRRAQMEQHRLRERHNTPAIDNTLIG